MLSFNTISFFFCLFFFFSKSFIILNWNEYNKVVEINNEGAWKSNTVQETEREGGSSKTLSIQEKLFSILFRKGLGVRT